MFLGEGILLAGLGSLVGVAGAVAYGAVMMYGLRTWWVESVGTTFLRLDVSPLSLFVGLVGGMMTAVLCIWWTLRGVRSLSPRSLMTGSRQAAPISGTRQRRVWRFAAAAALVAFALMGASQLGMLDMAAGSSVRARSCSSLPCAQHGVGLHQENVRPGSGHRRRGGDGREKRVVASRSQSPLDRHDGLRGLHHCFRGRLSTRHSQCGSGSRVGHRRLRLLAESLLPVPHDLNTDEGRINMNFTDEESVALEGTTIFSFLLRPGEDVSCLNLYQPRDPRVLGVPDSLIEAARFSFQSSLATNRQEEENPWALLRTEYPDGAIPAIADAHTLTYILKRKPGEDFVIEHEGRSVRLRLVAALADSLFQSELLISSENFRKLFPYRTGFRYFLIDEGEEGAGNVAGVLEQGLSDSGLDVMPARERLETFHRVESTYISTFQSLGGLGLLLGTLGLTAVMLRNVLERRKEMALLRAAGYRGSDLATLVVAENAVLLFGGLLCGVASAVLAILPALLARGSMPGGGIGVMLGGVVLVGLSASVVAVVALLRMPLLASLRSE